ncbi:hypothetical protein ACFPM1_05495 [Halorubrum rubrum]|jgi:tRNA(Ile2) C34 agmatinyltransferase TiaS|uniref:Small CPxCG-related zinc finger protein n=1 Tax=Halorubrum rubrum TaxID=1126240 RepID=A0ABD5QZU7_9EURY|nr:MULTISPECIES: hypothetical protein [Halorubrum]
MTDDGDEASVRSSTEYARSRVRCPNCGDHVPAVGRDAGATECPNCRTLVRN